jgi:hypothetical protein
MVCVCSDVTGSVDALHVAAGEQPAAARTVGGAQQLACGAGSGKARFLQARLLLLLGRLEDATHATKAALAQQASSGHAAAHASSTSQAAVKTLLTRIQAAARRRTDAERALALRQHGAAWAFATAALDDAPLSAPLRLLRGAAALELGLLHAVKADALLALRAAPSDAAPWALLARAFARLLPCREGLAAAQRALAACLRGSPDEAACAAPFVVQRALLRAWAAVDDATATAEVHTDRVSSGSTRLVADALHVVRAHAAAAAHDASAAAAHAALCALHADAARAHARAPAAADGDAATAAGSDVSEAVRWCSAALSDHERARAAGSDDDADGTAAAAAAAACALHRAWARLLGGAPASLAAADAAAARALAYPLQPAFAAALDELDAAVRAAAAAAPDYYALLNVSAGDAATLPPAAWAALLRKAYRRAALAWHPDKRAGDAAAAARFMLLADAFRTLSDADARREYDEARARGEAAAPQRSRDGVFAAGASGGRVGGDEAWEFRYDRRDVDEAGDVRGAWVHRGSGARRAATRATPHPGAAATTAVDPCAPGGAAAGRCLPGTGGAEPPSERPQHRRGGSGSVAPLQPPPALHAWPGCSATARVIRNHFGLQTLLLEFTLPTSPAPARTSFGPRTPAGVHTPPSHAYAGGTSAAVHLAWHPASLAGITLHAGDVFVYELKWLSIEPIRDHDGDADTGDDDADGSADEEADDDSGAAPPLALVSLDVALTAGSTLSGAGVVDQWGEAAGADADLRSAMARHGSAGWLERRLVLPAGGGAGSAVRIACAHAGGVRVRAAARDVRVLGSDGATRAVLLASEADGDADDDEL